MEAGTLWNHYKQLKYKMVTILKFNMNATFRENQDGS